MTRHAKPGTRAVSINISEEERQELLRLTGEKTLTAAVHKALADLVLDEQLRASDRTGGSITPQSDEGK